MLSRIFERWRRARRPLREQLRIDFDLEEVRVRVLDNALDTNWNQTFAWADVTRVCFQDGGVYSTDMILVRLLEPDHIIVVPTEADGAQAFFGELTTRGLFPESVWRKAMGETAGGTHCWPPFD